MQLLKTKFHIPGFNVGTSVSRKRLSRIIGDNSSLVMISAPAGFGKTTLLSEWAEGNKVPVTWVSLEKSEDVPDVFWRYFMTAVSSVSGGCGEHALEQIKSAGSSSIETVLTGVINEITGHGSAFSLVLDDYHVISDESIHRGIAFFIDHLPANMRLIIAGRDETRLSVSKLRVSGKLTELRAAQFRFDADEAERLLNGIHGLNLSMEEVGSLTDKTEGWIAGLALAILSIKEQKDRPSFIRNFAGSHRYIIDYLIEEVLSGLETDVREFMLKLSVLERFCPGLCLRVTEHPDSSTLLSNMEQNNLFLVPLDHQREWFRYHHLFRECLLKKLEQACPGEIEQLHWRAFLWHKENGFGTEAFHHGVLAGRYRDAADLLSEHAPELFSESGGFILKQLIARLPEGIVKNSPDLCCYDVLLSVFAGNFDKVDLLYQDMFKGNETVSGFLSLIKSYRYFYQTGEFDKSISELNVCLRIMPEKHVSALRIGELLLSLCYRYIGDIGSAYEQVKKITLDDDIPGLKAISYVDVLVGMGKLQAALTFIDRTIENGLRHYGEGLLPEYGYLYVVKAGVLRERDEIAEALKACRKGLDLGRNNEYVELTFLGNLEYARILAADRNYEEAEKAIEASIEAARASSTWGEFMSAAYQVRIELSRGNTVFAGQLLKDMVDPSAPQIPYYKYHEYLSFCRYCLCMKETQKVHAVTDLMIAEDLTVQRDGRLIECYVLKAIAYHQQNDTEKALETLGKAFALSINESYVRVFIDEGEPVRALFRMALEKGTLPDYLKTYVDGPASGQVVTRSVMINEFQENFNEREIEILQLMKQGCSNKNIADTLCLSVNTVRWYASRIFGKLNVKRRGEAVAFAEKYELI